VAATPGKRSALIRALSGLATNRIFLPAREQHEIMGKEFGLPGGTFGYVCRFACVADLRIDLILSRLVTFSQLQAIMAAR
jgi:hypothetical protein